MITVSNNNLNGLKFKIIYCTEVIIGLHNVFSALKWQDVVKPITESTDNSIKTINTNVLYV